MLPSTRAVPLVHRGAAILNGSTTAWCERNVMGTESPVAGGFGSASARGGTSVELSKRLDDAGPRCNDPARRRQRLDQPSAIRLADRARVSEHDDASIRR